MSVTRPPSSTSSSWSEKSEICWRNSERLGSSGDLLVLARDADELLQVLDPPLGLDGPLGLERLDVAGLLEDALDELGTESSWDCAMRDSMSVRSFVTDLSGAAPQPASSPRPSASQRLRFCASAKVWRRASVVSPIPRRGRFAIRSSETASAGLSITCR